MKLRRLRRCHEARERTLAGKGAGFRKPAALGAYAPGKLVLDRRVVLFGLLGSGMRVNGENGGQNPDSAERRRAKSGTESHHRARLSAVCVKSLSSSSVWN